jgi:pyruvate kinase
MRRQRSTKIVATLGPASTDPKIARALFEGGVDVFRLNLSHGTHEGHAKTVQTIRALEREMGRPIGILTDLQGPKLRVGEIQGGKIELKTGQRYTLDLDKAKGDDKRAPLPHREVFAALEKGTEILIDDGRVRLRVETAAKDHAALRVEVGGTISDHKGVNVPNTVLALSPLTAKDRSDLRFALDAGADWIGLSFVQRPEDIAEAKKLIAGRAAVMAKIEKPAAVERLDEIATLADAIMVARGDLGVELPPEDVPAVQKRIVRLCRAVGKPVVVATQMLESMISAPAPTRAEASDVATAVYDGADAVMLSGETATGKYPREAVTMMNRIIERVERDPLYRPLLEAVHATPEATAADAITAAARQVAHTVSAAAIVTFTTTGSTALRAARERPDVPILSLTPVLTTARKLAVAWGLHCAQSPDATSFAEMVDMATAAALAEGFAKRGDRIVVTAGVPFGTPGATNVLRIAWVGN